MNLHDEYGVSGAPHGAKILDPNNILVISGYFVSDLDYTWELDENNRNRSRFKRCYSYIKR